MSTLRNWVRQKVSTIGTGEIVLTDSISSFIRFSAVYTDGEQVFYSLIDGNNRENGIGTYIASGNRISRDVIFETLENGSYTFTTPPPITLSGNSRVAVMPTAQSMTAHESIWKSLPSVTGIDPALGYTAPGMVDIGSGIMMPGFDPAAIEALGINFKLNHDVVVASEMYPTVQWMPTSTQVGTVRWGITFAQADKDTGNFGAISTIYLEQESSGVNGDHQSVEAAQVDAIIAGNPDQAIVGFIFRDATHVNDTYTGDAVLVETSLKYSSERVGTPQRATDFFNWA